ncbi:uncharacterized protein LOC131062988 [Cryptomeria japonica]|uniref:uncharacterized protein LOC131062988 n=1 Tax=Cryptomeria japonica TaxID=3369 RepID=UPI0027DA2C09|nr:uncharacterized protein LOC131062988 [Cryptomeria japonica]
MDYPFPTPKTVGDSYFLQPLEPYKPEGGALQLFVSGYGGPLFKASSSSHSSQKFLFHPCDYSIIGRAKASQRPDLVISASSTCHILPSKSCSCIWSSQVQGIYSRFSSIKRDYHQSIGGSAEMGTKVIQSLKHIHDPELISYISQMDAAAIDELLMGPLGFSVDQLMELAGLSVATSIAEVYKPNEYNRVLIICGPGNNGGDGLVAARHLYHFGYMPFVCYPRRTDKPLYHGLVTQLEALAVPFLLPDDLPTELASDFDIIVDAMFGFSFHGTPRPPFDALIHKLVMATASTSKNGGTPFVVSVDIPSGWHVEEGDINDTGLSPDMLVSLTAPKLCVRKFTGPHHFLGGRFVPPEVARKYSLQLPQYPDTAMCVRIGKPPSVDVSALRENYISPVFLEEQLKDDPIKQFQEWFEDAVVAGLNEPNAMALATTDKSGHPSVRMVLLKGVDEHGFVWYTNYESRKAHEILENPNASILFFWEGLHRQELFRMARTVLTPSTSYHPQTDGQTEIVNKWIEGYLRNYVTGQQTAWVKWLHLGEHCYNTTHHMSIGMSPFQALYGYEATSFGELITQESKVPRAQDFVQQSMDIMKTLKENLQQAQNQQKIYADRKRTERSFEAGDLVFLRLQPYKQSSLKKNGAEKLKPRFYGPFKVIRRIGEVAYEIELPKDSKIHNVFHVSRLKKVLGQHLVPCSELPPLDDEGKLTLTLHHPPAGSGATVVAAWAATTVAPFPRKEPVEGCNPSPPRGWAATTVAPFPRKEPVEGCNPSPPRGIRYETRAREWGKAGRREVSKWQTADYELQLRAAGCEQCPDLILECAKHYNQERKTISTSDGKLLAILTPESIGEAFRFPSHHSMTYKTINGARAIYEAGPGRCGDMINNKWLLKPRPHISKMPKILSSNSNRNMWT